MRITEASNQVSMNHKSKDWLDRQRKTKIEEKFNLDRSSFSPRQL